MLFQTVPKVALAPLFILWFGFDLAPKVLLIVVIAFFPVTLGMMAGLQSVDPALVALMRSVGAGRGEILRRVQVPHSLPQLMSGTEGRNHAQRHRRDRGGVRRARRPGSAT